MKHRSLFIAIVAFLTLPSASFAQDTTHHTVKGKVVETNSSYPLPFVNVALMRPTDSVFMRGASTDYEGMFAIPDVAPGTYLLRATFVGFDNLFQTVEITGDMTLEPLRMKPNLALLKEINITGTKPVYAMDGEKNMYNTSEDPSVQTGTAADALRKTPGVEVDAAGNISLRGVSSVDVWINDHPSNLSGEALNQYIKQLPANSIERVEVITNPSARYASKSGGGIINIVTSTKIKRNQFLSVGANAASMPFVNPWLSYVYANEKLNVNLFASGNMSRWWADFNSNSVMYDPVYGQQSQNYSVNSRGRQRRGMVFASMDYQFDTMNSLSFQLIFAPGWQSQVDSINTHLTPLPFQIASSSFNGMHCCTYSYIYSNGTLWYQHKFNNSGHQISASLSGGGTFLPTSPETLRRHYENLPYQDLARQYTVSNSKPNTTLNIDYVLPYSKNGEIGMGVQYALSAEKKEVCIEDSAAAGYATVPQFSYNTDMRDKSVDGYLTLQQRIGRFTVKGGLRAEYDNLNYHVTNTTQTQAGIDVEDKAYLNWRPSLHLSYSTEKMDNFNLSYSRHIAAPGSSQLTTFREYFSKESDGFTIGNPGLQCTYTNSFEGGWTKYIPKVGSVGVQLYHKSTLNQISSITDAAYCDVFGNIVGFTQDVNLGNSFNTGGELNLSFMPGGMMALRLYANVYHNSFEARYKGLDFSDAQTTYSFRLSYWQKFWHKLDVFASANYSSASVGLFTKTLPSYSMDGGASVDLLKHKLSLYLVCSDIFNWRKNSTEYSNPDYQGSESQKIVSRFVSLGAVVRFGKMELERKAKQGGTGGAGINL